MLDAGLVSIRNITQEAGAVSDLSFRKEKKKNLAATMWQMDWREVKMEVRQQLVGWGMCTGPGDGWM